MREQRLTATFELNAPIRNASNEWIVQNQDDIEDMVFSAEGSVIHMKPIVLPFSAFTVYAENGQAQFPDWVEFTTTYEIERHPWFMHFWIPSGTEENPTFTPAHPLPNPPELNHHRPEEHQCCEECSAGVYHHLDHIAACRLDPYATPPPPGMVYGPRGHETDYVIIDEAYEHDNEEIRAYLEAMHETTRRLATDAAIPQATYEAFRQDERGSAVLRGREETEEGWTRQMDAREQP
jgi:hypothetical protein